MKRLTALLAVLLAMAWEAGSQAPEALKPEVRLVADVSAIRPGETFRLGVHLRLPEGAHVYWRNPGDGGLPTRVVWRLPSGFSAGELQWPVPERFRDGPLVSHGYDGEVLLWTTVRAPESLPVAAVRLRAEAEWLLCRETCIPGKADLALALPVRGEAPAASEHVVLFSRFEELVPQPADGWSAEFADSEKEIVLTVSPPEAWPPERAQRWIFIPVVADLTEPAAPQTWRPDGDRWQLRIPKTSRPQSVGEQLEGVLFEEGTDGRSTSWFVWLSARRRVGMPDAKP